MLLQGEVKSGGDNTSRAVVNGNNNNNDEKLPVAITDVHATNSPCGTIFDTLQGLGDFFDNANLITTLLT
jgi:hypothetical protein